MPNVGRDTSLPVVTTFPLNHSPFLARRSQRGFLSRKPCARLPVYRTRTLLEPQLPGTGDHIDVPGSRPAVVATGGRQANTSTSGRPTKTSSYHRRRATTSKLGQPRIMTGSGLRRRQGLKAKEPGRDRNPANSGSERPSSAFRAFGDGSGCLSGRAGASSS
jgi:hypothetical protein